jgi:hypothetical protein
MKKEEMKPDVQCCTPLEEEDELQLNFVKLYLGATQKGWTPLSFNLGKKILSRWKKENKEAGKNWKFFSYTDPTKLKTLIAKVPVGALDKALTNFDDKLVQLLCKKGQGVSHETKFIGKPIDMDQLRLPNPSNGGGKGAVDSK